MDRPRPSTSPGPSPNPSQHNLAAPNGRASSRALSSAANSVASSDAPHDGLSTSITASSGDGALDKFKGRSSEDGHSSESGSHRRKMSRLFKGRRGRRRSAAQDDAAQVAAAAEDVPPLPEPKQLPIDPPFQSEESLGLHKSVPSSLLTEDSDTETPPVRPSISPRNSHAPYLTLSSPLIAAETIDSTEKPAAAPDESATSAIDQPTPKHAQTLEAAANIKRSPSPVGKLKEAFSPIRKSTIPKTGAEQESPRPGTSGGGLGSLFGGVGKKQTSRRGSKVLDETVDFQASPPQIQDGQKNQSTTSLPSSTPKRIITSTPGTPPNLVHAPTTLVTPPTPTDSTRPDSPTGSTSSAKQEVKHSTSSSNPNIVTSPSGNMISHRRARSSTNPPSKLSNAISAPLTPTAEEVRTPGGTAQSPSGFFSSVFTAAQTAANSLSNIANTSIPGTKGKGGNSQQSLDQPKAGDAGGEEVIGPETADGTAEKSTEKRQLAVETLGSGNLSLAQLGISDSTEPSPMSSATNLAMSGDQASAKAEDIAAAQAVSAAYAAEKPATLDNDSRPRSITNVSAEKSGAVSPPRQTDSPVASTIQRTGSIRSRISGGRKRRHRNSSATTGNTIAAGIASSTTTLAPQTARLNGTGFAVASSKRNRDFHNLFKSVPEDDYLIEDYSAALQKEILLQGRLYVSEGHLCFSSNILGWVTNLVISFDEIVSVEKKSTAVVFPNAIVIQTLHARNVFASFLTRDATYDLIIGIWKISHPNLKSSLNGVALDGHGTGDKTEKAESVGSDAGSLQDSDDEVYDEDEDEDGIGSFTEAGEGSIAGSEQDPAIAEKKASAQVATAVSGGTAKLSDSAEAAVNGTVTAQDFPGAATHAPTDCGDNDQHYDKLLIDTTIPAPLGKIYSMMFGPASGVFMRKWLIEDQKSTDLQMEDDKKGLGEDRKTFNFSYIKPLGGSIGPKQTKCNTSMTLEQFDLDKAVTVLCSTGTPDVPNGNIFLTKTRYCLMWAPGNATRLLMTFTVEWSGKSWLKGPIEKGANDGQITYATALTSALRAAVSSKTPKAPGKAGKLKKGRNKSTAAIENAPIHAAESADAKKAKEKNWGPLEPIRGLLGPVADIVEGFFSLKVITSVLVLLLIYTWFFRAPTPAFSHGHLGLPHSQRLAAYEEIWRTEESELWRWLEERVSLDQVATAGVAGSRAGLKRSQEMEARLRDVSAEVRALQMDEAIRVTEERLEALKGAVERNREKLKTSAPEGGAAGAGAARPEL